MVPVIQYVQTHSAEILAVLFALSEALALIPGVKANSVFQAIVNGLKKLAPAKAA